MRIYVVDLESVPTRYTCEWKSHVQDLLRQNAGSDVEVINISGGESSIEATPGAFLNFQQTNIYKNNQLNDIAARFTNEIKAGDRFLFLDAWHTGILQLKYMSELLGIPVEIHALWHAGSYDPYDFLGRLIENKNWTYSTERALYHAIDYNWFATNFHKKIFSTTLLSNPADKVKMLRTGWPMEYMPEAVKSYVTDPVEKEDIIIFPHRLAPEKQPEIFRDIAASMPQYKFVVCQDNKLTKKEYHTLLAKSKIMWSANLQETLGISPFEGALHGVVPMLPDRLSYTEMYDKIFLYPSEWTDSYDSYLKNKDDVLGAIEHVMKNYATLEPVTRKKLSKHLLDNYFSATELLKNILR